MLNRIFSAVLVICMVAGTAQATPNWKLPWTAGESWQCQCSYGCYLHTDDNNGYYSVDFDKVGIAENGPDQPVLAAASGTVIFTGLNGAYGHCVKIDHGGGYVSMYAHLRYNPTVSGTVTQGQQIGVMGGTGTDGAKTYNDHIHFMVYYNGQCKSYVSESKPEPMSGYTNFTATQYYTSDNDGLTYSGSYVTQTPTDPSGVLHLVTNEVKSCSFTFHNAGTATWSNDPNSPSYLELHSVNSSWNQDQASGLAWNWISGSTIRMATTTGQVAPNGNGLYSFTIKTPSTPGHYTLYVALYHYSAHYITGTGPKIEIEVVAPQSFSGMTLTPIAGDWNGDGVFEVGVYANETQTFYLDTDNDGYTELELHYSSAVDKPLSGDWNGDAYYSVGFYRPAYRVFWLDYDNNGQMDVGIVFGDGGDTPLAGDWLGNGVSRIGLYRPSTRTFWLDYDNNGVADFSRTFGDATDIPVTGDWDCDQDWNIGIYRPSTRTFWLDYNNDGAADFSRTFGDAGDLPIVGDWTGNCGTNIGIFRPSTQEFWLDYNSDGVADRGFQIQRMPGSPKIMIDGEDNTLPLTFALSQNYPNPFNPVTTISYTLPAATYVSLNIYNILGQKVATLVNEKQEAGEHQVQFDCSSCASGIYFYTLSTEQATESRKMLLLK